MSSNKIRLVYCSLCLFWVFLNVWILTWWCHSSGRLYQTHPRRGQNLLHDPPPESSQRPFPGCPPLPSASSSSAPPCNYGNYQNCTIVQSHLPCSAYGSYVTLPPKTLIFPVFVQVRQTDRQTRSIPLINQSHGTAEQWGFGQNRLDLRNSVYRTRSNFRSLDFLCGVGFEPEYSGLAHIVINLLIYQNTNSELTNVVA